MPLVPWETQADPPVKGPQPMKRLLLLVVTAALLAAVGLAPAASASPPLSGTLVIDQAAPAYGDTVTFTAEIDGNLKDRRPFITTVCIQGADVVFQVSVGVDEPLELVERVGLDWDQGPAECESWLRTIERKAKGGKKVTHTTIAIETFSVAGAT